MKASELMIGDWVNHHGNPRQIRGVVDFTLAKDFEPIPLTSEILEKNGFVRKYKDDIIIYENKDYVQIEMGINYRLFEDGRFYLRELIHRLYYVHELQHALRLCGLNELADNFKV